MPSPTISVRLSTPTLIPTLQHLERTAATVFGTLTPALAFIASVDPLSDTEHRRLLREGVVFVASASPPESNTAGSEERTESIAGFLAAEILDKCVFVVEINVGTAYQRCGVGGALLRALFAAVDRDEKTQAAEELCGGSDREMRERLETWNGKKVTLTTFVDVPWNGPWYVRQGFVPVEANNVVTVLGSGHREKIEDEKKRLERDGWVRGCFVRLPRRPSESSRAT